MDVRELGARRDADGHREQLLRRGNQHPYQADATAELVQRGSVLEDTTGRHDAWGDAFEPRDFYDYRLDPAAAVPALVERFSGPQKQLGAH